MLEVGEDDQDGVDTHDACGGHLADAPRPAQNLPGAEKDQCVRVVADDTEEQRQVLEVVRVQEHLTVHPTVILQAQFEQSTEGAPSLFVVAQEELKGFPHAEPEQANTPQCCTEKQTHHGSKDCDKQPPNKHFVDIPRLQCCKKRDAKESRVQSDVQVVRLVHGPGGRSTHRLERSTSPPH